MTTTKQENIKNTNKETKHQVTVYSTEHCPWCHRLKDFLKQNKVEFKDYNVGEDQKALQEMIHKSGQMGVPVIDIDGKIIVGFDVVTIKKALEI
ncbi:MAG: glutaredoxin domain-containing protein [Candidatus Woesearchaeota archaeon]